MIKILIKKIYYIFCKFEEIVAGLFLSAVTLLVFISAIARSIRHPINWANEVSLLLFAWFVFLGADLALRNADFVNVDIFVRKLPKKVQGFLYYIWSAFILIFLAILIRFGIPLSIDNSKRLFQTLGISYFWATISVSVGAALMITTIILKLVARIKEDKRKKVKN